MLPYTSSLASLSVLTLTPVLDSFAFWLKKAQHHLSNSIFFIAKKGLYPFQGQWDTISDQPSLF